jgi:hypothetical protein
MFRRIFYWGLSAGIGSAVAALIYNRVYFFITEANFTKLVNTGSLIGANLLACMLAAFGYWALTKWLPRKGETVFNIVFAVLTFVSILIPIAVNLPLDIQFPELFPGLTIPMHFFPALAWHTFRPLFAK